MPEPSPGPAAAQEPALRSFNDLLHHPNPPLELLDKTKEYAKACRNRPESATRRRKSAKVLYYASIVAAMIEDARNGRINKPGRSVAADGPPVGHRQAVGG